MSRFTSLLPHVVWLCLLILFLFLGLKTVPQGSIGKLSENYETLARFKPGTYLVYSTGKFSLEPAANGHKSTRNDTELEFETADQQKRSMNYAIAYDLSENDDINVSSYDMDGPIKQAMEIAVRDVGGRYNLQNLISQREKFRAEVTEQLRKETRDFPVTITGVYF